MYVCVLTIGTKKSRNSLCNIYIHMTSKVLVMKITAIVYSFIFERTLTKDIIIVKKVS